MRIKKLLEKFSDKGVIYDDFNLQENIPLHKQIDNLKEDLFQIEFSDNTIFDIGWYSSPEIKGCFKVYIVQNFDWETPLFQEQAFDLDELYHLLCLSIAICDDIRSK